jgi:hypothetical protein
MVAGTKVEGACVASVRLACVGSDSLGVGTRGECAGMAFLPSSGLGSVIEVGGTTGEGAGLASVRLAVVGSVTGEEHER